MPPRPRPDGVGQDFSTLFEVPFCSCMKCYRHAASRRQRGQCVKTNCTFKGYLSTRCDHCVKIKDSCEQPAIGVAGNFWEWRLVNDWIGRIMDQIPGDNETNMDTKEKLGDVSAGFHSSFENLEKEYRSAWDLNVKKDTGQIARYAKHIEQRKLQALARSKLYAMRGDEEGWLDKDRWHLEMLLRLDPFDPFYVPWEVAKHAVKKDVEVILRDNPDAANAEQTIAEIMAEFPTVVFGYIEP